MMATGFFLLLFSVIVGFGKISWTAVGSALISFPSILFFLLWIGLMIFISWYRKNRFKNDDAKSNWTAQIVNAVAQICLLLGILFA